MGPMSIGFAVDRLHRLELTHSQVPGRNYVCVHACSGRRMSRSHYSGVWFTRNRVTWGRPSNTTSDDATQRLSPPREPVPPPPPVQPDECTDELSAEYSESLSEDSDDSMPSQIFATPPPGGWTGPVWRPPTHFIQRVPVLRPVLPSAEPRGQPAPPVPRRPEPEEHEGRHGEIWLGYNLEGQWNPWVVRSVGRDGQQESWVAWWKGYWRPPDGHEPLYQATFYHFGPAPPGHNLHQV